MDCYVQEQLETIAAKLHLLSWGLVAYRRCENITEPDPILAAVLNLDETVQELRALAKEGDYVPLLPGLVAH